MKLTIRRLLAYWIDVTLAAGILISAQGLLYFISSGFPFDYLDRGYEIELWVLATISLPVWLYFIFSELTRQTTIGKKLLGLHVMSEKSERLSFPQAFLRTLIKLLPWEMTHLIILVPEPWWSVDKPGNLFWIYLPNGLMILYIAVVWWNGGVKGIHDFFARTFVVESKK